MARILLIDPSAVDRKRMRNVLEAAGHSVVERSTPAEATEGGLLDAPGAFSLVLTELQFPDTTGLAFLRWFRQREESMRVPVLVVTEQPPRDRLIEMIKAGATTIVAKPFGSDMLLRRVTEALNEFTAVRQGDDQSVSWPMADYLRRELKRMERRASSLSVLVCRVLSPSGEPGGTALLRHLSHVMREYDVVARLSDDEVVIMLPDTDASGAEAVLQRIHGLLAELMIEQPDRPAVSFQMATGVATYPAEAADADSLVTLAQQRAQKAADSPPANRTP